MHCKSHLCAEDQQGGHSGEAEGWTEVGKGKAKNAVVRGSVSILVIRPVVWANIS